MSQVNRWLIASAVALTALLTDVAANAFPGRTVTRSSAVPVTVSANAGTAKPKTHHHATPLHAPSTAPQTATQAPASTQTTTEATQAATTTAPPVQTTTQTTTATTSAPAPVATPAPAPVVTAPVVSGGS